VYFEGIMPPSSNAVLVSLRVIAPSPFVFVSAAFVVALFVALSFVVAPR
jgi:hypothetical protein